MDSVSELFDLIRPVAEHVATVMLILALTFVVARLVRRMLRRLEKRLGVQDLKAGRNLHRSSTLTSVLRSLFSVTIWTFAAIMVLGELGAPVDPLLAGAGIVGVAIAFGAQNLVRDLVAGFFLLLEDQYRVGDEVDVIITYTEHLSGTVERVRLRSTALRAANGTLHQFPHGVVQVVSNLSAGWSQATLDVGVAVGQDLGVVREALNVAGEELRTNQLFGKLLTGDLEILGVEELSRSRVTLRVVVRTAAGKQTVVERALRQHINEVFTIRGIALA